MVGSSKSRIGDKVKRSWDLKILSVAIQAGEGDLFTNDILSV